VQYEKIQERMKVQNEGGDDEATVKVVRQMLGVLDNYDRAFGVLTAETDEQKEIEDAYRATYDKILATFESLGVTEVETVGAEFDYEVHQAVMQRPSDDYEEGIVCEELAKGFVLEDKLIRAAMVSVAA
jgi:molecular chaperone GrpE